MADRYAVDTNVLLRLSHPEHIQHTLIEQSIRSLVNRKVDLCYTSQSIGEFWNVGTRPANRNGLGLSVEEVREDVRFIQDTMTLLPENEQVLSVWLRLLFDHRVLGVQVHDAHLAAVLEVHSVSNLLTLNGADFKRFPHVVAVHPQDLVRHG
jgi:predicted nucleic acid-binding protein